MSRAQYEGTAREAANEWGIPPDGFVELVNRESAWNPSAVSPVGAAGLGQLMPAAALQVDLILAEPDTIAGYEARYEQDPRGADAWLSQQPITDLRLDPTRNLYGSVRYLAWLVDVIGPALPPGQPLWPAVLAAYNAGPGVVLDNMRDAGRLDLDRLPPETRDYVIALAPAFPTDDVVLRPAAAVGMGLFFLALLWFVGMAWGRWGRSR